MTKHLHLFFILLFVGFSQLNTSAQDNATITADELAEYKLQIGQLVAYFEETLNFIGDPFSMTVEKEVIINESYLKIFRDDKVQVEDDLDENRDTPLNKDVQAYLKDVDFFFRSARFDFEVVRIDQMSNVTGELFFRVELIRRLNARSIGGDTISNARQRFMEINLDPFRKELKIVSIYTTKLNEREELRNWWNTMPIAWKRYFAEEVFLNDTVPFDQLFGITPEAYVMLRPMRLMRRDTLMVMGEDTLTLAYRHLLHGRPPDTLLIRTDTLNVFVPDTVKTDMAPIYSILRRFTKTTEVNIAYKQQFTGLEPLSQLSDLRTIDFSNTPVNDLLPLRNLNKLDAIYMSGTGITDLSALRYSVNIKEIYCFDTEITSLQPLSTFRQLEKLYCFNSGIESLEPLRGMTSMLALRVGNTGISNIDAVSSMENLRLLDISNTKIKDLSPIAGLRHLQMLSFESTGVTSLEALTRLNELTVVQFSNTGVSDLTPLSGKPNIRQVYCDNTLVSSNMAIRFMRNNPSSLVIFESEELAAWWESLPIYWKAILSEQTGKSTRPSSEDLHEIITIRELDLSGNRFLQNLQPVGRLSNLTRLSLSRTEIVDLSALIGLSELRELNLSDTRISNLDPLQNLIGLEQLNIQQTRVEKLDALQSLSGLRLVLADGSRVETPAVVSLRMVQPQVLVVYQTGVLREWWDNLQDMWRDIFEAYVPVSVSPTPQQLQSIANLELVEFAGSRFTTLEPLRRLLFLNQLTFSATSISDLEPLRGLRLLSKLDMPNNPVSDLKPLSNLANLKQLNIENTPVSDLSVLNSLKNIERLNISGTQVRNLKAVSGLNHLEDLSFFNTRIRNTSPAENLPALKHVKCYNTRISARRIQQWRDKRPDLNILYY